MTASGVQYFIEGSAAALPEISLLIVDADGLVAQTSGADTAKAVGRRVRELVPSIGADAAWLAGAEAHGPCTGPAGARWAQAWRVDRSGISWIVAISSQAPPNPARLALARVLADGRVDGLFIDPRVSDHIGGALAPDDNPWEQWWIRVAASDRVRLGPAYTVAGGGGRAVATYRLRGVDGENRHIVDYTFGFDAPEFGATFATVAYVADRPPGAVGGRADELALEALEALGDSLSLRLIGADGPQRLEWVAGSLTPLPPPFAAGAGSAADLIDELPAADRDEQRAFCARILADGAGTAAFSTLDASAELCAVEERATAIGEPGETARALVLRLSAADPR